MSIEYMATASDRDFFAMRRIRPKDRACLFAAIILLNGCLNGAETDQIAGYASQQKWVAAARPLPVLHAGQEVDYGLWNDPSVIKIGDEFVMYMATSITEPFKPPILPFRAVSKDGINWKVYPKTPLLSASETPFANNETPNVIFYLGKYHMYYTGVYPEGDVPSMAIGHAVSDDGIVWRNDKKPVLQATGELYDWNGYLVAEPGAVVFNDKIYLYYTAMGQRVSGEPHHLQSIGLAISSDGGTFDRQRQVLTQSATYPHEKGFIGYSTPFALVHEGKVHLVYDIAAYHEDNNPQWQQLAIHHAVSDDGIAAFREDALPMLTRSDFPWTSGEIISPTMVISDNKVRLWFAGHVNYDGLAGFIRNGMQGPEVGIGYAEMDLADFLRESP